MKRLGVTDCGRVWVIGAPTPSLPHVALRLPTEAARSEEEGKLLIKRTGFCRGLQVAVLPIRAIKQGYRVL